MYRPDLHSSYSAPNETDSNTAGPSDHPNYYYPQHDPQSNSNQYASPYQYGTNQNQYSSASSSYNQYSSASSSHNQYSSATSSQNQYSSQSQYGSTQFGGASSYQQYGETPHYSASPPVPAYPASPGRGWDRTPQLSTGEGTGHQNSGKYSVHQGGVGYSGSGNRPRGNSNYSSRGASRGARGGDTGGTKFNKVAPFKTDHIYDCPNNGQPIQCVTCDVNMPSYSIASIHFNSPKHHRKKMNSLHYPTEKRRKLVEISETDPDTIKMECDLCSVKPGSYNGFLSHMSSLKHIRKLNNIGPETRTFNIKCAPCGEQLNIIEHLQGHVNTKSHVSQVARILKEQYPDLKDDSSQWHCAACNKSCNSMQTFDTHCASTKHMNKVNTQKQEQVKQLEQAEKVDLDSEKCLEEPPPPINKRRSRPLKIEREVVIPDLYQCKVCNFGTSEKFLIDKHYETASHRANKLLKRRHDELYRVADVGKCEHKGVDLGEIVPLNAKGAVYCDVCELSFAHDILLEIHKRGKLHKELPSKLQNAHEQAVEVGEKVPTTKGGHHCDACSVHTSCLTRYLAHVSSKDHRKMMTQLAKRGVTAGVTAGVTTGVTAGVTADVTADPSQQCEPTAPAPPDAEQSVSNLSQPQGQISGEPMKVPKKKKKKKKDTSDILRTKDYLHGLPSDGIPPEAVREDGRFGCKLCCVVVQQQHSFIQHCQSRKHRNKTNIAAETSGGATGPKNITEVFFCKMCDVSCPTGKDTLAHLSSKEHEKGPALKVAERGKKETEGEEELDASEITKKFFCDVCSVDCRTESSFNLHMKGVKHMKKLTALTDEADTVMGNVDCGNSGVRKNLSCPKCQVHCKSITNYEQHCASFEHLKKMSLVTFPTRYQGYNTDGGLAK